MKTNNKDIKEKSIVSKEEWREYTKTVWHVPNVSHKDHPAVFPEEIPKRLVKLFSFWGETVLDPFGGIGTTSTVALKLGRKAISYDSNRKYVGIARKEVAKLNGNSKNAQIILGSSEKLDKIEDESVGLIITSPPYWNKADYGKGKNNLGNISSYKKFLKSIEPIFHECYRVLMPGRKFCVVTANVNQYTNHGLLTFPLSLDFGRILRDIGFVMINEIIWSKDKTGGKWGSYGQQRPIFGSYPYPPNFLFKNVHEYVLIFAKPDLSKKNGPKALNYEDLMKAK